MGPHGPASSASHPSTPLPSQAPPHSQASSSLGLKPTTHVYLRALLFPLPGAPRLPRPLTWAWSLPMRPSSENFLPTFFPLPFVISPVTHDFVVSPGVANSKCVHVLARLRPGRWAWGTGPSLPPFHCPQGVWKSRGSTRQVNEREDSPAQEGCIREGRPRARVPPSCPTAQCQAW